MTTTTTTTTMTTKRMINNNNNKIDDDDDDDMMMIMLIIMSVFLVRFSTKNMLNCAELVQTQNTKHMHKRYPKQHVPKQRC